MRTRRLARCIGCELPLPVCLCETVAIPTRAPVLMLVHHVETFKTTNTARLAQRALGARFERWGIPDQPSPALPEGKILLLFPSEDARLLTAADAEDGATLVVPDGTWPQARKIARRIERTHANVTRVKLAHIESHYGLRKTTREGALSTFESVAHALAVLDDDPEIARRAIEIFAAFVARHARFATGL